MSKPTKLKENIQTRPSKSFQPIGTVERETLFFVGRHSRGGGETRKRNKKPKTGDRIIKHNLPACRTKAPQPAKNTGQLSPAADVGREVLKTLSKEKMSNSLRIQQVQNVPREFRKTWWGKPTMRKAGLICISRGLTEEILTANMKVAKSRTNPSKKKRILRTEKKEKTTFAGFDINC